MRETARAKQAFNDYLGLGEGRSFDKLLEQYRACPEHAPTVHRTTLKGWSVTFAWQARLAEIAEAERAAIVARGIADRQNRIDALNDRWQRMRRVIEHRAEQHEELDLEASPAAGASTGLMVLTIKYLPSGARVEEWAVDTGLLKEMREHEKQAAQELGQWIEKGELTGKGGGPLVVRQVRELSDDELAAIAGGGSA